MRITLQDVGRSRIPAVLGKCATDWASIASYINEAQQRLINALEETGAWNGWEKIVFNVLRCDPYITLPPRYARMVNANVCKTPVQIFNEWYEVLWAGPGLQEPTRCTEDGCLTNSLSIGGFDRATVPTAYDLAQTNQRIRAYITDPRDVGKRILISEALDQNGNGIYTQDVLRPVNGFYLTFEQPFVDSSFIVTSFRNVAKDETFGDVVLKQVDDTTGEESLLSRYTPGETNPAYHRYYIQGLPARCCPTNCDADSDQIAQVTVMAKLEYVPVVQPSDFLVITNIPALKEECEAIRYGEAETPAAVQMAALKHKNAIRLLNEELGHYVGKLNPSINFAPFGVAGLERRQVGIMI